jgi:hypothetical protein
MRLVPLLLLLSITSAHAQALFLAYRQWEQMPTSLGEMYVAGAFDTLSIVTTPEQVSIAKHYNECVAKAGLSLHQLAENVKEYADTKPELQDKPTPGVLLRYLISLCGAPAQ